MQKLIGCLGWQEGSHIWSLSYKQCTGVHLITALENTGETLLQSSRDRYTRTPLVGIYDARLDAASATAWHLISKGAVTVFFLDTADKPHIDSNPGWSTESLDFRVFIDVVAGCTNYKKAVLNSGS